MTVKRDHGCEDCIKRCNWNSPTVAETDKTKPNYGCNSSLRPLVKGRRAG